MNLLFIYNANSGKLNAYLDSLHKIFSPKTYPCSLCDLTYGVFKENKSWKSFRESATLKMQFLHIDEFEKAYRSKWLQPYTYPVVLLENGENLEIFISKEELDQLKSVEELIGMITKRSVEFTT